MPRPMQTILKTGVDYSDHQRPVEMTLYDENHEPVNIAAGGVQGPKGDKGDTGDTGPAGADGEDGAAGAAGPATLPALEGFIGKVAHNQNPVAGSYTWTAIPMATDILDTGNSHTNNARWTVHRTGWYRAIAHGVFANNGTGWRGAAIFNMSDGARVLCAVNLMAVTGEVTIITAEQIVYLTAGHVLEYRAQHNAAAIVSHYADGELASGMDVIYLGP